MEFNKKTAFIFLFSILGLLFFSIMLKFGLLSKKKDVVVGII